MSIGQENFTFLLPSIEKQHPCYEQIFSSSDRQREVVVSEGKPDDYSFSFLTKIFVS